MTVTALTLNQIITLAAAGSGTYTTQWFSMAGANAGALIYTITSATNVTGFTAIPELANDLGRPPFQAPTLTLATAVGHHGKDMSGVAAAFARFVFTVTTSGAGSIRFDATVNTAQL